jgi:hypothetical protein
MSEKQSKWSRQSQFASVENPCTLQGIVKTGKFPVFPFSLFFTGYAIYSLYRMPKFPVLASASANRAKT